MKEILNNLDECVIVFDLNGNVLFFSDKALKESGYTEKEIKLMNLRKDKENFYPVNEEANEYLFRFSSKYGDILILKGKTVSSKWNCEDAQFFICNRYAKDRRTLDKILQREIDNYKKLDQELKSLLKVSADIMIIAEYGGKLNRVSMGNTNTLQWTSEEILQFEWPKLIHPEDYNNTIKEIFKGKRTGEVQKVNARIRCKDGSYRLFAWRGMYTNERNRFVATARDITEERKLLEERRKYEEAKQAEVMKNEFFANMSHEFKTPLNIILSTVQLIEYNLKHGYLNIDPKDKCINYMNSIKRNSYRLIRLSNNIIDMSKIDSGYYKLNLKNNNIVNVIEEIVDSVADYIHSKGMSIIFDTEVEEMVISCDSEKIERIVLNLISNAIKYTKENGEISINISIKDRFVVVCVKDNGIGIAEEDKDKIFDRFKQIENTFTRKVEGSGIGLSLVKSLVNMHGGKVWLESVVGKGSEFYFSLPITQIKQEIIGENKEKRENKKEKSTIEFADII